MMKHLNDNEKLQNFAMLPRQNKILKMSTNVKYQKMNSYKITNFKC